MKKIWRVENGDGQGCYTPQHKLKKWICDRHDNQLKTHPIPSVDNKIRRMAYEEEICGFINLKQALNWFTKFELTELVREGFILKEVMVKEITVIGDKQVLAIR